MNYHESLPTLGGGLRIIIASALALAIILCPISYHYEVGNHPLSIYGVAAIDVILTILLIYIAISRINIDVDESSVKINRCHIPASEVTGCDPIEDVHPYRKFGGIGIRRVPGKKGYTSSKTKHGVVIHRKNAPDIIVSTENPDELSQQIVSIIRR